MVKAYLRSHPTGPATVRLADEQGDQLVVPLAAVELLSRILAHMANGHGVSVVPARAELATQEAADRRDAADELPVLTQDMDLG